MSSAVIRFAGRWLRAGAVAGAVMAVALLAHAQQPSQAQAVRPQAKAPAPAAKDNQPPASDAGLRQRVEQLEEQLVDMQVVIGTLESLAKGATAPVPGARQGPAAAINASDAGRLDGLETQIRALAAQLEQLTEQVRALGGRTGALAPSSSQALNEPGAGPRPGPQPPARTTFGSVTVSQDGGQRDEIDRLLTTGPQTQGPPQAPRPQVAAAPPVANQANAEMNPKQLYETAYGYLLQRDYGAAEAAFDDFLRRHPSDPLAGNAQYWLGESLYVRGQYRAAANAFLKGYQSYSKSAKAPESLLKLAMSLQRLGQKEAACTSYSELSTRFPSAPTHVKNTAQVERQRAGCT